MSRPEISEDGIPNPGPPDSTWSQCPVDECRWAIRTDVPYVDPGALASVFGVGTMSSVAGFQHFTAIEQELDLHLNSHTVLEFIRTISRLQGQVQRLEETVDRLERRCAF